MEMLEKCNVKNVDSFTFKAKIDSLDKAIIMTTMKDLETIPSTKPKLSEFMEGTANVANNALSFIVPKLGIVISLINDIFTIHENAQFNKKMSRSIINRIASVEMIIKSLKSPIKYNEKFQDLQYQETFVRFQTILKKIKMFTETVTQLSAFETFLRAMNIKKEFIELMKEYEACMNDLSFTMIIVFNEQRRIDNDILTDTLAKKIKDTEVSLYQEICHIKNKLEKTKDSIRQIDPILLKEPSFNRRSDRRGKFEQIIKKVYKDFIEVACKSRDLGDQRFRRELLILEKLDECQNIEKFYGLSEVDGKEVMIFEWTEMGNLKDIYYKEHISWNLKARIAFEICKGIMFLDSIGIFHNDIRCENIMMSRFMEPKLANFQFAVQQNNNEKNITINQPIDVVNWMAPENMRKLFTESGNSNQVPYSKKCEIFSFGMLIWELTYQKIPYINMKSNDIIVHVTNGNREICDNFLDPENNIIHESFLDIIQLATILLFKAWREVPEERININALSSKLLELI